MRRRLVFAAHHKRLSPHLTLHATCGRVARKNAHSADALRFFFSHCQSQATGLLAWGEHLGWDFRTEGVLEDRDIHEFYRPWVLWEDCFALAPEACDRFARGVWEHQIADHATGNFNRHARYDRHGPEKDKEFSRHAGFYIGTWGAAYRRSKDPIFLRAIETLMASFERRRESSGRFPGNNPRSDLSWAIDVWDTAPAMPEPLAAGMRASAKKTDEAYHRKFAKGLPRDAEKIWVAGYGDATTAIFRTSTGEGPGARRVGSFVPCQITPER